MTTNNKGLSRKSGALLGASAAVIVAVAAFAGAQGALRVPGIDAAQPAAQTSPALFAPPTGAPVSFADIFERVSPAVVQIRVTAQVPVQQTMELPGFPGVPFQLPDQGGGRGGRGGGAAPRTREAQAEGSGFFISANGYIVTNNHVVEDATKITVVLKDEREIEATVVGTDPDTDLAVIKVNGDSYPFVNFENSANPRVGDWVIAIGNPFGLGGTATVGIVSAQGRRPGPRDPTSAFVDFLQIDAAINSGNSGGPTFDTFGRVIGVNSQILSPSRDGGSVGIGFAIPAELADNVTKQLIAQGEVRRGFLGATVGAYTKETAEGIGQEFAEGSGGAYVIDVRPDGPAERAGLKAGDIVLSVNGRTVKDSTELTRLVAATRTGDELRLQVMRDGKPITVNVRSGARPSLAELNGTTDKPEGATPPSGGRRQRADPVKLPEVLGLGLAPTNEETRRRFSIGDGVTGVVVASAEEGSIGTEAGLQSGDVIVRAGNRNVAQPQDVIDAVDAQRHSGRKSILLLVRRGANTQPVLIDLDKPKEG